MFVFTTKYDRFTHHVNDVKTLQDILLGYTDDEQESERITIIAGHMRFGDVFCANGVAIFCQEDK